MPIWSEPSSLFAMVAELFHLFGLPVHVIDLLGVGGKPNTSRRWLEPNEQSRKLAGMERNGIWGAGMGSVMEMEA